MPRIMFSRVAAKELTIKELASLIKESGDVIYKYSQGKLKGLDDCDEELDYYIMLSEVSCEKEKEDDAKRNAV